MDNELFQSILTNHITELYEGKYKNFYNELVENDFDSTVILDLLQFGIDISSDLDYLPNRYLEYTSIDSYTVLPNIHTIGINAFYACSNLKEISGMENVEQINRRAFSDCTNLTKIQLPDTLKILGSFAFANCEKLPEISFPPSLVSIENHCFANCSALTTIDMHACHFSVIPNSCFSGCLKLEKVYISDEVKLISNNAFLNCEKLKELSLPASIKQIESYAFWSCKALGTITFSGTIREWEHVNKGYASFYNIINVQCTDGLITYKST